MATEIEIKDPGNTGIPWERLVRLAFMEMGYKTSTRVYIAGIEADVIGTNDGDNVVCECKDVEIIRPHHIYKIALLGILTDSQPVLAITRRNGKTVDDLSKGVKELLLVFDIKLLTDEDVTEYRSPRKPDFEVSIKDTREKYGALEDRAPLIRTLDLMTVHDISR